MFDNISKLNDATEKFGGWAEKLTAAKSVLFKQSQNEIDVDFTRVLMRDPHPLHSKNTKPVDDTIIDDTIADEETSEARTAFLNDLVKNKIVSNWEEQGENGPNCDFGMEISEALEDVNDEPYSTPVLEGFNTATDRLELEYVSVQNPLTGECVAPEISVKTAECGSASDIYLNNKLIATIEEAVGIKAEDIVLVQSDI